MLANQVRFFTVNVQRLSGAKDAAIFVFFKIVFSCFSEAKDGTLVLCKPPSTD